MRLRVLSVLVGFGVLAALGAPAGAIAQNFSDHTAAAVDQYHEPTPTPTPAPQPTAAPGSGAQAASSPTPGGSGGDEDDGSGASRGDDDGTGGGDPSDVGVASDSVRDGSGAIPLTDSKGGRLPFTGLDLLTIALLGCALIAAGALLALATRRRRDARAVA